MSRDLASVHADVRASSTGPEPRSGRQERLENYISRFV